MLSIFQLTFWADENVVNIPVNILNSWDSQLLRMPTFSAAENVILIPVNSSAAVSVSQYRCRNNSVEFRLFKNAPFSVLYCLHRVKKYVSFQWHIFFVEYVELRHKYCPKPLQMGNKNEKWQHSNRRSRSLKKKAWKRNEASSKA